MPNPISQKSFSGELLLILEEVFETHHGIFLDKHTSLFDTLELISAQEASIPVGNGCATIAAQVEHVIYYLEVLGGGVGGKEIAKPDWGEIWTRVSSVNTDQWDEIKSRLRKTYDQLYELLKNFEDWEENDHSGDAMAIVVHTAYHLGEIRQAMCMIK